MIIKNLELEHFGKFHHKDIMLEPGINVIYGPNESGKSTVHSFIQCMLFGAERMRGRGAGKDIYTRYQPWEGSKDYEGILRFEYQGKAWRIVRNFHKDETSVLLVDEQEGKEYPLSDGGDLSILIEGLTLSNYKNSISSGQLAVQPDSQFTANMQSYMANMSMGGDAAVDVGKALAYLKEQRKKLNVQGSTDEELEACRKQIDSLRNTMEGQDEILLKYREAVEQKEILQKQIHQMELKTDEAIKADMKERARAVQLLQEEDRIISAHRKKKKEYQRLMTEEGAHEYQEEIISAVKNYRQLQEEIDDHRIRCEELQGNRSESFLRNIALILPAAAAAVFLWTAGEMVGLTGAKHVMVSLAASVPAVLWAVLVFKVSGRGRKRIRVLNGEIQNLKGQQENILKKYNISSIDQLKSRKQDGQGREVLLKRLREDMESLKRDYNALQEPLKPYLEKYGDTISLDSDIGLKEKSQIDLLRKQLMDAVRQAEQLEMKMEQTNQQKNRLEELEQQMKQLKVQQKKAGEDLLAIQIAQETITEVTTHIHSSFGSQLSEYVSRLLEYITDGEHGKLRIDENFQIQLDDGKNIIQPQQLSAGTVDQIYFAERMAVSQMLYKEAMPLILDDSFVLYDDQRLSKVLTWLAEQNIFSQIIIFTCHHREADILQQTGCKYHLVEL